MDSYVSVKEEVEGGRGKVVEESKDEAAVHAEMNSEVSVNEEVEGGGSKGKVESNNEAAVDAEMNSDVLVKAEVEGGESKGKEEINDEETESGTDEEEDGESSEASSSSEEESSEASSSSDEEQMGKQHGGVGGMDALIKEGELMVGIDDGDDDDEEASDTPIKLKHAVEVLPLVPKVEVHLEPHHKTLPVGTISAIMGERVIVEGSVEHNPLNEGSILWITESRSPLGIVEELFGPVKNPYYLVRYNSAEEVPAGISAGTAISSVMEFADHILNVKELCTKGYDESGDNVEDQTDDPEFSDDEKEAEYKRSLQLAKRQTKKQLESKKPSGDKKRKQRRDAGFRKDMPPRIRDLPTPSHQPHRPFHHSLGPQNFPMSPPTMMPSVSVNPAIPSSVQFPGQNGGCFTNLSQQFLPQQPNVVWPGGLPPSLYQNMGVNGAALAANVMQNILRGTNQYQQYCNNQNFGGLLNRMPISPQQFMPQSGMAVNRMPFGGGGPPVNPPFVSSSGLQTAHGNLDNLPHLAGSNQGPSPGFPNPQGHRLLPSSHGNGGQPPTQLKSGQFNHGDSSQSSQQWGRRH